MNRPRYYHKKRRYERKKSKFKQGYYKPLNEQKYIQPIDKGMNQEVYPEYRSSWEKKFMEYCDKSPKVTKWSTEFLPIPYIRPDDGQVHRYYPDFFILANDKKYIIEIKPFNQTKSPINIAKWKAAKQYCKEHDYTFLVLTEKELKKWGII
jgi:predicted nuclease of restriction endonuclease-like RecB superfamily